MFAVPLSFRHGTADDSGTGSMIRYLFDSRTPIFNRSARAARVPRAVIDPPTDRREAEEQTRARRALRRRAVRVHILADAAALSVAGVLAIATAPGAASGWDFFW